MMRRMRKIAGVAGMLVGVAVAGCGLLSRLVPPAQTITAVRLYNAGSYPVHATVWISDQQDIPEALLTSIGEKLEFTIQPGQHQDFERDCDDLQAITIDEAELQTGSFIQPDDRTDVQRDGTHFRCNDRITFSFVHSDALTDFHIEVDVRSRLAVPPGGA